MNKEATLMLCDKCQGKGYRSWDECVNYHKREYDTHTETCHFCKGSGRRWQIVTTSYEPYVVPKGDTE